METPKKKRRKPQKPKRTLPPGQKTVGKDPVPRKVDPKTGNLRGGRPPAWTDEKLEMLADCIGKGMTNEQAAHYVSIHPDTLRNWLKTDEPFFTAIKRAVAERLLLRIEIVEGGGRGWQAAAWLLERCYGRQFAPPKTISRVENVEGGEGITAEDLQAAESLLKMM